MTGKVFLVGAGPGDTRLLTLRGAELLASADVVVLDALVSEGIRKLIPRTARTVYAGKRASAHTLSQDEINKLLVAEAKRGNRVVRLKGGDPFVFGRGGEEAEELRNEGIPFEVVPGISSAIAGPAYAGIPVTHRSFATSLTLVTGHESETSTGIRWDLLAQMEGTVVFLMGLGNLDSISRNLISNGRNESTPVAVIAHATTPRQRTVCGDLRSIGGLVDASGITAPALIVVGDVVSLHETLSWFENRPLFGKRVVVTRARDQASGLASLLEDAGAEVLEFPMIEIVQPPSFDSLDHVIDEISSYETIVFSSTNGVEAFFDRLGSSGKDSRALAGLIVAAVGSATAAALQDRGITPDIVPAQFLSVALLPLLAEDQSGRRTAVVRALEGRNDLIEGLRARGGHVDLAIAYETKASDQFVDSLRERIAEDAIDAITFSSSSTVTNFFGMLTDDEKTRVLEHAIVASIGPVTTAALAALGIKPDVEAAEATVASLATSLVEFLASKTVLSPPLPRGSSQK